jgi:FkbM family methyltransferase
VILKILLLFKKNILKYKFSTYILSLFYVGYNNLTRKHKIKIRKENNYWVHLTTNGLIPYTHPLFNPEKYSSENFEVFFEHYMPKKDDIILELGSGIGNETLFISKLIGEKGKIYSLEPFESIFNLLKETVSINNLKNVKIINKALYKEKTKIGFSSDQGNWLGGKIDLNSKSLIETITLNNFIEENNIDIVNFCKINIEGAERYILNNSDKFFNVCQNLSIECHDFLEGNEYKTHNMVKDFLISKKFKILKNIRNKKPWDKYFIYASK